MQPSPESLILEFINRPSKGGHGFIQKRRKKSFTDLMDGQPVMPSQLNEGRIALS
jgi:hypothetical protein